MINWLIQQETWIGPILNVLIGFACLKYIILDW